MSTSPKPQMTKRRSEHASTVAKLDMSRKTVANAWQMKPKEESHKPKCVKQKLLTKTRKTFKPK
jgi:hypothetical protein